MIVFNNYQHCLVSAGDLSALAQINIRTVDSHANPIAIVSLFSSRPGRGKFEG
jgi:hypothetical protein